jgi:hypothetical protein
MTIETDADLLAMAEDVRHGACAEHEDAPAYPVSFGEDFRLPEHSEKLLQTMFADDRGGRIHFFEKPHVYTIDGRAYDCSVTYLVKGHCEDFNAKAIIGKMRKSRRVPWPRLEYAVDATPVDDAAALADADPTRLLIVVDKTGTTVHSAPLGADGAAVAAQLLAATPGARAHLAARGMTDAEIVAKWDVNKVDAANRGTWIHWNLELWSNSMPCHVDVELMHGIRFIAKKLRPMGVKCWATEKEVFGEAENVCGSVDWIGYYEDDPDALIIVDWKRSKNLADSLVSAYRKHMTPPLQHLHDVDGCKYALQLGCYAFLLEKYYGKRVRALALCCVHPDSPTYTFVPYLKTEVAYLMRKRRETVAARARVLADHPELERCALTGGFLYDAVRCEGKLCNRKDALVAFPDAPLVDAPEITERARELVAGVRYGLSAEEAALAHCRPWSELMPDTGLAEPV